MVKTDIHFPTEISLLFDAVALGVVGRNLHRLGGIILEKKKKALKRKRKLRLAA